MTLFNCFVHCRTRVTFKAASCPISIFEYQSSIVIDSICKNSIVSLFKYIKRPVLVACGWFWDMRVVEASRSPRSNGHRYSC